MLTKKQHELLLFINESLSDSGISPSFDEMKDALNLKSKSGIHRLISALEERGFIRRLPHRARALEVIKLPGKSAAPGSQHSPAAAPSGVPNGGFDAKVIHGDFKTLPGSPEATDVQDSPSSPTSHTSADTVELPLYGRIAAGTPIEALRDETNRVDVPASLLSNGEHYALEVDGDSMIDAGIFDGDTVLINKCDSAENGSIIVALVDEEEVTLKRLRRKGASVALEPANKNYETRIFGPDRVRIQGRLVGLLRKY